MVVLSPDHTSNSATGTIHGMIDGREHIGVRPFRFHTLLHAHVDLAACPRAGAFFRLGEIDGHAADALAEPTQREAESEFQVSPQSLGELDAVGSNLNLHLTLSYCAHRSALRL